MTISLNECSPKFVSHREPDRFAGNWVPGANEGSRSLRRRLLAVLRMSCRILGLKRRGRALGRLGEGLAPVSSSVVVAMVTAPLLLLVPQSAQAGSCFGGTPNNGAFTCLTGAPGIEIVGWNNNLATPNVATAVTGDVTGIAVGIDTVATGSNAIAVGAEASASGNDGIAIGNLSSASGEFDVGIGAGAGGSSTGDMNVSIGRVAGSGATGSLNTALGGFSGQNQQGDHNTAVGVRAGQVFSSGLANGSDNTAVGYRAGQNPSGSANTAIGVGAGREIMGSASTVVFADGYIASGLFNTAVGANSGSSVNGSNNTAIGLSAGNGVIGDNNIALGKGAGSATFTYGGSIVSGPSLVDGQWYSTAAMGTLAVNDTVAIGTGAMALADEAAAIGKDAVATGGRAVSIGSGNIADGDGAVAIGDPNRATGQGTIAQGFNNTATGNGTVATGNTNMVGGGGQAVSTPGTAAQGAVGIGYHNTVVGQGAVAIGDSNVANGASSIAMGSSASATAANALALGGGATAGQFGAVALGSGSTTAAAVGTAGTTINGTAYGFAGTLPGSTVSVGAAGAERSVTNVAAGRLTAGSTDAVNGSQLYATNLAVTAVGSGIDNLGQSVAAALGGTSSYNTATDTVTAGLAVGGSSYSTVQDALTAVGTSVASAKAHYFSVNDGGTAQNNVNNDGATGVNAVAVGPNASASGLSSVALGNGATAQSNNSVAIGSSTTVSGASVSIGQGSSSTGNGAVSLGRQTTSSGSGAMVAGYSSTAAGQGAISLGNGTVATGTAAIAMGDSSLANSGGAIAMGAAAVAGAGNSIALGSGASAGQSGAVALGANSVTAAAVATTGTTINGASYTFAGTAPTSTVSVGAAGSERTVTNVAAGRLSGTSTDAVNGSQLYATNQAVNALGTDLDALGGSVATSLGGTSAYSSLTHTVTAGLDVDGTAYTNVQDALTAVNSNAIAGWVVSAEGANATTVGLSSTTGTSVDLANSDGNIVVAKTATSNNVTFDLADDLVIGNSITVGSSVIDATGLTIAGGPSVTTTGVDAGGLVVTNVASGTVAAGSTDAVNGGQLFSVSQAAGNTDQRAVKYDWTDGNGNGVVDPGEVDYGKATLAGGGSGNGTVITNLADGAVNATSSDAVNGSQLFGVSQSVATALGGTSIVNPDGTVAGPTYVVQGSNYSTVFDAFGAVDGELTSINTALSNINNGGGIKYFHANSTLADSQASGVDSVAIGPAAIASGGGAVAIGNGASAAGLNDVALGSGSVANGAAATTGMTIAGESFTVAGTAPVGTVSVGGMGSTRTITNVAAGQVAAASTDAVNGSQLYAAVQAIETVDSKVDEAGGSIAGILGGGATYNASTGTISGASFTVKGTAYNTVTDAFSAVDGALTTAGNVDQRAVKYDWTDGNGDGVVDAGEVDYGTATLAGDGSGGGTRITNLADGSVSSTSTDAINGSQLFGVSQSVATNLGGGSVVNADGTVSAPTYNIAGSDYANVGDALDALDDQSANAVQYDTDASGNKLNSVTLKGGDPNAPVLLSNVATGVADTDAVNVKQLNDGMSSTLNSSKTYTDTKVTWAIDQANTYTDQVAVSTLNQANSYTDYKFGELSQELGEVRGEARQAAAIGLAAASLRYDDRPGKASVAIGGGVWRGEGALAFGAGYTSEEGRVRANVSGTVAGGQFGVGAGLSFTLN